MNADERVKAILTEMSDAGLTAIIAVCGGVHAFQRPNAVFLLSGVRSLGESFVVLSDRGDSTLVVSPAWDACRARERSKTTVTDGAADIREALAAAVGRIGLPPAKIGIVGLDSVSFAMGTWLSRTLTLGNGYRRFDAEFLRATQRKSDQEIANAERATRIAEQGWEMLLSIARPGMQELELATEICNRMTALGADDHFLMLSASQHARAVRPPSRRILEAGDVILCEMSPGFDGQFSQICRTAVVGELPDIFETKYELLREAVRRGMKAAVPGASVADVVRAMNRILEEAGYAEFCVPPHMRARGHGLGVGSISPGDLTADNRNILDRDMVFVIHPNQYMPETGYMMCGEPVVVTGAGARPLTTRLATLDRIAVRQ
jgi:Xaa-Pro aminopeptidase